MLFHCNVIIIIYVPSRWTSVVWSVAMRVWRTPLGKQGQLMRDRLSSTHVPSVGKWNKATYTLNNILCIQDNIDLAGLVDKPCTSLVNILTHWVSRCICYPTCMLQTNRYGCNHIFPDLFSDSKKLNILDVFCQFLLAEFRSVSSWKSSLQMWWDYFELKNWNPWHVHCNKHNQLKCNYL